MLMYVSCSCGPVLPDGGYHCLWTLTLHEERYCARNFQHLHLHLAIRQADYECAAGPAKGTLEPASFPRR